MELSELNESQKYQLKCDLLSAKCLINGTEASIGELAEADSLISDKELEKAYGAVSFTEDDFWV